MTNTKPNVDIYPIKNKVIERLEVRATNKMNVFQVRVVNPRYDQYTLQVVITEKSDNTYFLHNSDWLSIEVNPIQVSPHHIKKYEGSVALRLYHNDVYVCEQTMDIPVGCYEHPTIQCRRTGYARTRYGIRRCLSDCDTMRGYYFTYQTDSALYEKMKSMTGAIVLNGKTLESGSLCDILHKGIVIHSSTEEDHLYDLLLNVRNLFLVIDGDKDKVVWIEDAGPHEIEICDITGV